MREKACLGAFEKIAACAGGVGAGGCFDLNSGGVGVLLPRPFGERAGVRGLGVGSAAGRDVRPAAHLLSFAPPKESRQRKGGPTGCVPPLRCGQPAVLAVGVRCGTRFALKRYAQTAAASQITMRVHAALHALTPPAALLGASRGEGDNHTGHRCARPWVFSFCGSGLARDKRIRRTEAPSRASPLPQSVSQSHVKASTPPSFRCRPESMVVLPSTVVHVHHVDSGLRRNDGTGRLEAQTDPAQAERSDGPFGSALPSGRAEKRRAGGGRGSAACRASCSDSLRLSERSERSEQSEFRSAAPRPSIAGCPQRSEGTRPVGPPFFCLLFFGETKKSRSPAGANSRPAAHPTPRPLTPTLSPKGRGSNVPGEAK